MNKRDRSTAMPGPRRFQWQAGAWFGSVFGGSAWLIPTAALLAFNGQAQLALIPAGSFLLMTVVGVLLWYRRDRLPPFLALVGMLAAFAVVTPFVWYAVAFNATPESLAALNWPQHGLPGILAVLICPLIIGWLCVLEYVPKKMMVPPH